MLQSLHIRKSDVMKQELAQISIVVSDYDEALDFYINNLNFILIEDSYQQ